MRGGSPEAKEFQEEIFAALPGFFWCGGCGTASREISETEAGEVIELLHTYWMSGSKALDALDGAQWFMETYARYHYNGVCCCAPLVPLAPPIPTSGCYLYRLWGADRRLLYVGVSVRLASRLRSHRRKWGDLIEDVTWEEHDDERSMLTAEREAIREEDPAFNKAGVG